MPRYHSSVTFKALVLYDFWVEADSPEEALDQIRKNAAKHAKDDPVDCKNAVFKVSHIGPATVVLPPPPEKRFEDMMLGIDKTDPLALVIVSDMEPYL